MNSLYTETTRPLRFTAEGVAEKGYLRFKGSFRLRQTDYKITAL